MTNQLHTPAHAAAVQTYDDEIDLRPYLLAVLKHWRYIIVITLLAAGVTGGVSLQLPRRYVASASVLLQPTSAQMAFDQRFVTNQSLDFNSYRQGLLSLITSNAIEAQIPDEARKQLVSHNYTPGDLTRRISVAEQGNLLVISAEAPTARQAQLLADTWATTSVAFINTMSAGATTATDGFEQRIEEAHQRYTTAQQAYEAFLATTPLEELTQSTYAITTTLEAAHNTDLARYTGYLERAQELDLVLRDAKVLQAQLDAAQPANLGESIAMLALRARASGSTELPVQLQFEQPDALARSDGLKQRDLDVLIRQVEEQIGSLHATAGQLSRAIADGSSAPDSALSAAEQAGLLERLRQVQRQLEAETGKQRALKQERDVALEALQIMQRKIAEQQVVALGNGAQVRLATSAALPDKPSSSIVRNTVIGAFAGLCLGVILVVARQLISSLRSMIATHNTGTHPSRSSRAPGISTVER